jgi:hypothetical protein
MQTSATAAGSGLWERDAVCNIETYSVFLESLNWLVLAKFILYIIFRYVE